jgi:hypothetical protein
MLIFATLKLFNILELQSVLCSTTLKYLQVNWCTLMPNQIFAFYEFLGCCALFSYLFMLLSSVS